jgi:hypothetical protein
VKVASQETSMQEIKDIVSKVVAGIPGKTTVDKQEKISKAWERVLKNQGLTQAKISGLKEETLVVNVDSPARLYQFNLKKKKILDELSQEIPEIKKIYFKIGKTQ